MIMAARSFAKKLQRGHSFDDRGGWPPSTQNVSVQRLLCGATGHITIKKASKLIQVHSQYTHQFL
jgi:hypothetical protein